MKGNISLKDFIKEVKEDLKSAIDQGNPFFLIGDIELEVTFILKAEDSAGAKFIIVDVGGKKNATQSHKVKIKLFPFEEEIKIIEQPNLTTRVIAFRPRNKYIPPVVTSSLNGVSIEVAGPPKKTKPLCVRNSRFKSLLAKPRKYPT